MILDDVSHQTRISCYNNIRKFLQENEINVVDRTTTDHGLSSRKKRKLLHRFLDEDHDDDDFEGNKYGVIYN